MRADVVLAGVGGQGVVTIARLLAEAALADGLEVVQGELHGMSQRGGAVHAQLRLADEPIESPQVPRGRADLLLGLEPVEALRSLAWLAPAGRVVSAIRPVENVPDYPPLEGVLGELRAVPGALLVDAHGLAVEAGSARSENFVMAGAAAALLPIQPATLRSAIERRAARWAAKDREAALRALEAGLAAARQDAPAAAES
jgi:indolepyruvate ferredoxin oxidoreductase beta subunit